METIEDKKSVGNRFCYLKMELIVARKSSLRFNALISIR